MAKRPDKLVLHGRKWVLRQPVPRSVRHLFLSSNSKPMAKIVMPLDGDYAIAKVVAADRVARCVDVFARCKAGIITTPEQAKAALHEEWSEPDVALQPGFDEAMRRWYAEQPKRDWTAEQWARWFASPQGRRRVALRTEMQTRVFERIASGEFDPFGPSDELGPSGEQPATRPASTGGETISQALEGWIEDLTRNKPRRPATLKGHRTRAQKFIDKFGDVPLTDVTREMAYGFRNSLGRANRTCNNHVMTLSGIFKCAKLRGKFKGENPFEKMLLEDTGEAREPFTVAEMQTLFDNLPRDVNPKKHSPATALPWVVLIAAYSGACLEEICQLTLDDIRDEEANGGTVTIFDIHNGDGDHQLKNEEARPRYVPVHSVLARALREYVTNLRKHGHARLFPGLKRRASKDNKWSPEVGSRFRKTLIKLGLKREGLCFHSFRHTVNKMLEEEPRVPEVDRARVLGHSNPNMTARYGKGKAAFRSAGPMLKVVAGVVEEIRYEGLRL